MRFKLLSVFFALQLASFTLWSTVFSDPAPQKDELVTQDESFAHSALELASASLTEASANEIEPQEVIPEPVPEAPLYLPNFTTTHASQADELINPIQKNQLAEVLSFLPAAHVAALKTVTLDYDPQAHRGLGGGSMIILRAVDMASEEFIAVFIHELGHNVDYAYLPPSEEKTKSAFLDGQMPLYETDPSLDFYRISWFAHNFRKPEAATADFVSGYAMSDPFEDFAETYAYYVLHNEDFKILTQTSDALLAKYNFMKNQVFSGQEFESQNTNVALDQRPWDVTVLPYDLNEFMG